MSGLPGFDGGEPDLAIGSVTGVRWWNLRVDDLSLTGVHVADPWKPGENAAWCNRLTFWAYQEAPHDVPWESCGCGFWAYWQVPDSPNPHNFGVPVLGVIEGYGRTLIGDRGFRCGKARITALHVPAGIDTPARCGDGRRTAVTSFGRVDFRTDDAMATWEALCGRPRRSPPPSQGPDESLARKAAVELALGDHYGVPVYASRALMLAEHPPTGDYLPPAARRAVCLPGPRLTGAEALARVQAMADPFETPAAIPE